MSLRHYVAIARPDHWVKNVFVLPGVALALVLTGRPADGLLWPFLLGLLSTCCAASANYAINEWLDRDFDRHHPSKRARPAVHAAVTGRGVALEYALLVTAALGLGAVVGRSFVVFTAALLLAGLAYNLPPVRLKDRAHVDVLWESLNNPIRLLLGWSIVAPSSLPPSSILVAYWMGGAFLMGVKRFAELRSIADAAMAGAYRRSFRHYTADSLLLASFFHALSSVFFLGVFLLKYRIEFLLTFPLFALLFTWYLALALGRSPAAQAPEKLWREGRFLAFVAFLCGAVTLLFFIDIPWLHSLLDIALLPSPFTGR